jgi:EAL domain-containing protein (putative c-di-GMP-specific phosphodiesterase class I)
VDTLKIDISFVNNIENETGRALVKAILALANALDLDVVAEGVESRGQARALSSLGCRAAQGYYFAKPAPASSTSPTLSLPAAEPRAR